jgi:hypothetical protein
MVFTQMVVMISAILAEEKIMSYSSFVSENDTVSRPSDSTAWSGSMRLLQTTLIWKMFSLNWLMTVRLSLLS